MSMPQFCRIVIRRGVPVIVAIHPSAVGEAHTGPRRKKT